MRTLLALAALCVAVYGQSCSRNEYSLNTRDYLNQLGKAINKLYNRVKTEPSFQGQLKSNITKAFNEASCSGKYQPTSANWIHDYLRSFRTKDNKPVPPKIVSLAQSIEEYLWEVGKDHVFSGCVATKIRDNLVEYIQEDCMNNQWDNVKNGLDDFPVPIYAGDSGYEQKLRSALTQMAAAYLSSTKCGSVSAAATVVRRMNEQTEEDVCYAADDAFPSDGCYNLYKQRCRGVVSCINNLVDNFKSMAKQIFGDKGEVINEVKDCIAKSNAYWKGNKPAGVPGAGTVLAKGLRLWREVNDVQNVLTDQEKKEAAEFLKAIIKAHFRAEACDCENIGR